MAEGLDVIIGAGFLAAELIAGETENREVFGVFLFYGFVELLKPFVLWREAAFGGGIDDEDDFVFVAFEGDWLPFLWWCGVSQWGSGVSSEW